ncbi:MAG: FG-GAP-like repeat-containing protein [Candidatus Sumerlaeota bacterium]|nr:FG-GAP-like repeat-containing protein [Candidatus Sumerlaeota bacterium]
MDSNKNVTLNFVDTRPYTFTIFKTGNGSFLVNGVARQAPWQGGFRFGEVVSILAVPDPGWTFLNWETDLRGSDNPEAVFMDADKTVTGNFTNQPTATLTLNRTGNGQARVNGLTVSLPWTGIFLQGDQVTVQSMAAAGWSFARYTGDLSGNADPQTLTMDTNKTVTLVFLDTPPLTLTLSVAAGLGSATVDGDPVTLPWTGGFRENEIVNIVPVPAPPDPKTWYFLYWLVDHVGNEVPLNLLMDSSKDITLSFGRLNPTIRYVDDDAPNDPGPNDPDISDPLEDGTFAHPFDMIQEALDVVEEGDTVIVLTGYYEENLIYPGLWDGEKYTGYRDVILRSGQTASPFDLDPDNTTIDGGYNGPTVRFFGLENAFSTLQGFTITGGSGELGYGGAIDGNGTLSTVIGNIIDSNDAGLGGAAALCYGPFTNNTFSNNGAATGGALYQCRGPILNNIFEGNGSSGNGGALANCNNRVEGNQFIYNIASTGRYNNNAGGGDQYGGAIYNCNGPNSVFIKNVFESNFAEREGGAIYQCGGNIINNVFDSNVAGDNDGGFPAPWGGRGGALSNCDGEITSNTFTSNIAYPDLLNDQTTNNHPARNQNTGMGGAIYNCGGRIDHNIFDSNYAVYGWTDYQSDADDVHKNPYGGEGGAIHSCPGQIDHNVFTYNLADIQGGALHSCSGEINNNMIVDNVAIGQDYVDNNGNTHVYAPSGGGAIYNCNGGSIVNCTIYNNYAGYNCGGIEASDSSIRNCILWENGFTNSPLRNSSTPTYSIIQHWTGGGAGNLIADPQVVDAANGDYHLTPGSPAIDAGSAVTGETDDYEGDFRPNLVLPTPKGDGSGIDIGADEFYLGYPWVPPGEGPPYQLSIKRSGLGKVRINGEYISMPYSQRIYRQGEVVHIEAIPGDNYFFFAWKGTLWTAANPLDLTMDGDKALTVVFITGETPYRLSLDMAGAGTGKVLVNGVLVDLPWQGLLNNAYKNVTLQAVPDPGFFFMNWSGDLTGNLNPTNIVVDQDRHVTVSFSNTQPYNLYITRSGQGVVWVNGALVQLPWAGAFLPFSSVTLQAGPSLGWYFSNWSGQVSSGSNPYTLIMDNNKGVIANFVNATPYLLTLDRTGQGSVKVNGNQVTPPWTGRFLENQVVTLEPVPDPFWHFLNYTGDVIGSAVPEHLAMDGDKNVTLNFVDVEPFIVDVFKAGTGSGSLKVNGQETSLPWQGKYPSDQATSITLEAVPNPGSYFMNWSGDLSGSFNPDQLRVDSDKQVTATFSNQEPATLYATGSGNGHILVDGVAQTLPFQGNFAIGSVVTVEAAPDPFWFFFGWSGDSYGSANPTTILMDTDKAITATFAPTSPYSLNLWKNGAGRAKVNGRLVDLPWQGNFNTSDTVTLEAVPDPNINFIKWSGDLTGNASPAVMVMGAQSKNIWVNFSDRPPVALTVTGNGQGQVSVEGVLRLLPWTEFYAEGDVAQLAASPMPGWGFLKWWGDLVGNQTPVGLLMDEDKDVTAIFIPFSDLDYSTAFLGMTINEHSGLSVAGAGDVNGDGYADLLIGAPDNSEGGKSAGKVYLVLGRPDQNFQHVNALAAVADASFLGAAAGDRAGGSIVSAGDVNGDGYADFLVGAPGNDANSKSNSGKAYLLLGTANPSAAWGLNAKMETVANASFAGEFQNDNAGFAVGGATNGVGLDVNGDGLNDFLIGAYGNDEGGGTLGNATTGAGKTYLLLGRSSANWGKNFALANAEASFLGEGPYDFAGYAVSGVGDANGDGFGDFIIGAYNNDDMGGDSSQFSGAGKAYLLLGAADPAAKWGKSFKLGYSPLNPAQGADAFFYAMVAFDGVDFGRTLAGVGDSNHDGYMDFIVGGPAANYPYGTARGQADLVLGRAVWNKAYSTGTDVLYMGEGFADQFGWAAAGGAGNINGDNYDDVIVGAPRYNYPWTDLVGGFHNEQQAGRVYIDPPPFQPATGAYGPPGERAFDMLGTSCAGLGDFNGDGIDDYVVGAPMNDDGGQEMGKTYVLYGLITTPSASSMRQTVAGAAPAVDFATARARIKYQSGSKSVDTMTIQRSKSSIAGLGDGKVGAVADVCWRLETTRQGFTGQVTFHYTQTEIRGMNESAMRLYQAPGPAGPWALVTGQTVDVNRNLVKGTITSGGWFALSVGSPQGPPTLGAVSDNGGGLLKLTWSQAVQTPAQVLAFAWDIYLANWSDKGVGGSMWFLFAGGAKSGSLALDQSGGYHAWVSNQYYDGGWRPCGNPWTGILYSGKPHTPVGLSVEDRGGGTMRLHWKPEWYGTWHDQIIVYKDGAGWVPTQGPSGTQLWHFVDFGYLGFVVGTADFFAGWGDFHLSPGTYYFYIRGVGWDGVSIGDFAVVGVTVP